MQLPTYVKSKLAEVQQRNTARAKEQRQKILVTLKAAFDRGESIADNAGVIQRYHNTKPARFNQMQEAFAEAVHVRT